jgi:mannose/fructose-specific phosphotransferase system component IIA
MSDTDGGLVPGMLVAHGDLAHELKRTAEKISGGTYDLLCFTNHDLSPETLAVEIGEALDQSGPGTIVMVDLAGGSCLSAVLRATRTRPGVHVIAGINLPLVLDFLQNRDTLPPNELAAHLLDRGHAGLKAVVSGG